METELQHGMILPTQAHIRAAKTPTDTERASLMAKVKSHALEWDDSEKPEFFSVIASGAEIDSYGTFMMSSTLRNFAKDAEAGVSVLDSHNHQQLGFGQSVTGAYVTDSSGERMESTFFTIPGLSIEGRSTDAYIRGIKRGLWRDISVGFWLPPEARIICTICGKDMMRWQGENSCRHFPGQTYDVSAHGTTRREVAYGGIDGARLSEYSLVYDGATPGAGVAKARQMEDAGVLSPDIASQLERLYPNVRFSRALARSYAGVRLPNREEKTVIEDVDGPALRKPKRRRRDVADRAAATEAEADPHTLPAEAYYGNA